MTATAGDSAESGGPRPADTVIAIRSARPSESVLLSRLALTAKAHWGYPAAFIEACRAELSYAPEDIADPRTSFQVAEAEGIPVGFYALRRLADDLTELEALFVAPAWIGRGIGRALIVHAKAAAARSGARALTVQADPNAERFYAAAGGRRTGTSESGSIPGRLLPVLEIPLETAKTEGAHG